jgi:hypothetical protein
MFYDRAAMGRRPIQWPRDLFERAVAENYSIAGVLRQMGSPMAGASYQRVHRLVEQYDLTTSHWTGQAHLRGKRHNWTRSIPLSEILVDGSTYTHRPSLKRRLIAAGLLNDQCAECGISEWRGEKLVLHLDHINGIGDDNRLKNLRLLCPNCDTQSTTYCGRNMRKRWPRSRNEH